MSLRYARYNKKKLMERHQRASSAGDADEGLTFEEPRSSRDFEVSRLSPGEAGCDCIVMRNRNVRGNERRALLYLYGGAIGAGGSVAGPRGEYVTRAQNIGIATGRDVWFALYPLGGEAGIAEAADAVVGVYRRMLEECDPAGIALYGFSVGGLLALGALGRINEKGLGLPMPSALVAVSPFACPSGKGDLKGMRELDSGDIELSSDIIEGMRGVLQGRGPSGRAEAPEYLLSLDGLDCTGFPPTSIYYGTYECLSAKAPLLEKALKAAGIDFQINLARGMCHNYCVDILFPESRQDYEEILQILSA